MELQRVTLDTRDSMFYSIDGEGAKEVTPGSVVLPWGQATLAPIGDIQHGSQGSSLDSLKRHLDVTLRLDSYYTGMGDYLDVASPSGRQKYNKAFFYDSVKDALDAEVYRQLEEVKKVLAPTVGRWLMLNRGHHWWTFQDGTDTDQLLAEYLGCPVTDDMGIGITEIRFRDQKNKRGVGCQIWQWHGEGSSRTMYGPTQKLEAEMLSWPSVDVFLMGHYSRAIAWARDPLFPKFGRGKPVLRAHRRVLATTGSFDKGYTVGGRATYVEKGGMPPLNCGGVLIFMNPVHGTYEDYMDLHFYH